MYPTRTGHQGRVRSGRYDSMPKSAANEPSPTGDLPLAGRTAGSSGPTSTAVQRVLGVQELLGMILTYLPPGPLHHAMEVSTRFRDTIKPTTPSGGNDMRVALGLRFSRRIEGMTESEHLALSLLEDAAKRGIFLYDLMDQILHRRFFWLMNVILDPRNTSFRREATHGSVPTLAVEPFNLVRIARGDHAGRGSKAGGNSYDENSRVMTLRFALPVKGNEKDAVTPRGIVKDGTLYRDNGRADWRGVTLLTMPFDVRICVDVDLREAMLAPLHHVGECQVPGCKVGVYGVQKTSILIPAAHATVGNLVTFLDSVEFQALFNAKRIRHKTNKNGYREHGEWYYMGLPSHPPPKMQPEWRGWW